MARKKKKLTRKQLNQQRQAAIERKRQERGWRPSPARVSRQPDEVIEDMLPLFPTFRDASARPELAMERLMATLLDSADLIEEPEFEEIIIDPMQCVETVAAVCQELGLDLAALSQQPDEEREDSQLEMIQMTIQRLLTAELRQEIFDALNNLRLRLKQSGQRKEAAKAAVLQSFLSDSDDSDMWSMIGLVQAIVQRSLEAGFELLEASEEVFEADHLDESESPLTVYDKLIRSSLVQKADALLRRIPGLSGFLSKQADSIWEEGTDAIFAGDLYLELFTREELAAGFDILRTTLAGDIAGETPPQEILAMAFPEDKAKLFVSQLDDYITRLFTPERLGRLRTRLNAIAKGSDCPKKWVAFVLMLVQYMAEEDAAENEKLFLIKAFLGEMRMVSAESEEAEE